MKGFLGFLAMLAGVAAVLFVVAPERLKGYTKRMPDLPAAEKPHAPTTLRAGADDQASSAAPWREKDREADRHYLAGDFQKASETWAAAAKAAPPALGSSLRQRADRARVYLVLSAGYDFGSMPPGEADEKAYAERVRGVEKESAGAWLDVAEFAASRNLKHHMAWLFDKAYEKRTDGTRALDKRLAAAYSRRKQLKGAPPPEVARAIIHELPVGEAATLAKEDTGGIGGSRKRNVDDDISDSSAAGRARELERQGDAEYRLAIPGSKDVNKHRRAALDLYTEARAILEGLDRENGAGSYGSKIRELNRNIAELRKDLPVGK
ncbi:MAG: hypothetical protein ACYTDX_05645 [Planctomycetota bacterium]|jgi:hypothetical protein